MDLIYALDKNPEEIKELNLVERIIDTLDQLYKKSGVEYAFVCIQSRALGGSCFPAPKDYVPSSTSVLLGKYDQQYFENKRMQLVST